MPPSSGTTSLVPHKPRDPMYNTISHPALGPESNFVPLSCKTIVNRSAQQRGRLHGNNAPHPHLTSDRVNPGSVPLAIHRVGCLIKEITVGIVYACHWQNGCLFHLRPIRVSSPHLSVSAKRSPLTPWILFFNLERCRRDTAAGQDDREVNDLPHKSSIPKITYPLHCYTRLRTHFKPANHTSGLRGFQAFPSHLRLYKHRGIAAVQEATLDPQRLPSFLQSCFVNRAAM